ncbi:MAG TPA: hypothetical protein PKK06_02445 [Phycisphaerae bacterium]|nr:hypothetical protein [Phycisphaerae bacterium]HNU44016.1 hypothetical protein [Phycisphaerae bacterium]
MTVSYTEPHDELPPAVREVHRAITSLVEELEAIDWYNQRAAIATEESLRQVLAHNRDEEIEHAVMLLEWLRRELPMLDAQLRERLFHAGPVVEAGHGEPVASGGAPAAGAADLGIGRFKKGS